MANKVKTAISPTRQENYPEWYQQVIRAADLAENSPVRGCMVIKPWGYSLWENMQRVLDGMFKATDHKNAYFPLFIPMSYLEKEAAHVEGFAKECAVVTHHRLEADTEGKLKPSGPLEEPLIVRPTSETIIGAMFSKWVQSYRDLPLLINQWANVVRWEMRTRLFLRTTEFLWQEGHTVHATPEEAQEETLRMLDIYADFVENYMAVPVFKGEKTESERFPGAVRTYTIEAMMQDKRALQAGTSHFLGQNFSRASDIKFLDSDGNETYAWTTSWGVSTRLIGALIMAHSDDDGFVVPPRLAPAHIVILPIIHNEDTRERILSYCENLSEELQTLSYSDRNLVVEIDTKEERGGKKFWNWVKRGVPIRLEIGLQEVENESVTYGRRNSNHKDRQTLNRKAFISSITEILGDIQKSIYDKAKDFRSQNLVKIDSKEKFYQFFSEQRNQESNLEGGFVLSHWNGDPSVEDKIKDDLGVTIRCIPLDAEEEEGKGKCVITGEPSNRRVLFAKAY